MNTLIIFKKFKSWENGVLHTQVRDFLYAQAQKQETSKQTKLHRKMFGLDTWYTISDVHNTNQIHTLKTLEFLIYESL